MMTLKILYECFEKLSIILGCLILLFFILYITIQIIKYVCREVRSGLSYFTASKFNEQVVINTWYVICLLVSFAYICVEWDSIKLSDKYHGNFIIFVFMLILVLKPFVSSLSFGGATARFKDEEKDKINTEFEKESSNVDLSNARLDEKEKDEIKKLKRRIEILYTKKKQEKGASDV